MAGVLSGFAGVFVGAGDWFERVFDSGRLVVYIVDCQSCSGWESSSAGEPISVSRGEFDLLKDSPCPLFVGRSLLFP